MSDDNFIEVSVIDDNQQCQELGPVCKHQCVWTKKAHNDDIFLKHRCPTRTKCGEWSSRT